MEPGATAILPSPRPFAPRNATATKVAFVLHYPAGSPVERPLAGITNPELIRVQSEMETHAAEVALTSAPRLGGRPCKVTITQWDEAFCWYAATPEATVQDIANRLGCSRPRVQQVMKARGILRHPTPTARSMPLPGAENVIVRNNALIPLAASALMCHLEKQGRTTPETLEPLIESAAGCSIGAAVALSGHVLEHCRTQMEGALGQPEVDERRVEQIMRMALYARRLGREAEEAWGRLRGMQLDPRLGRSGQPGEPPRRATQINIIGGGQGPLPSPEEVRAWLGAVGTGAAPARGVVSDLPSSTAEKLENIEKRHEVGG